MSPLEQKLDRLGKALHELAQGAQDKLEQAVEVGSKKIDLMSLRRSVDRELRGLGEIALDQIRAGAAESLRLHPAASAAVERLTRLESEIQRLETEMEAARQSRAGSAGGTTTTAGAAADQTGAASPRPAGQGEKE